MTVRDLIDLSLGNLCRIKLRAFLTIAGVMIAIAAFASLLSFGAGNQRFIEDQYQRFGLFTTMEIHEKTNQSGQDTLKAPPLDREAIRQLSAIPGVRLVFPYDDFEVTAYVADTQVTTRARVLSEEGAQSKLFRGIMGGSTFSSDSAAEAIVTDEFVEMVGEDAEALVGERLILTTRAPSLDSALLNVIDDKESPIWRRLKAVRFDSLFQAEYRQRTMRRELNEGLRRFVEGLMNRRLEISDTLTIRGVTVLNSGIRTYPIIIPLNTARRLTAGGFGAGSKPTDLFAAMKSGTLFTPEEAAENRSYPKLTLEFDPYTPYQRVKDSVEALGFRAFSYAEQFEEMQRFFIYYNLGLGVIGLIALVTAALGIVNTMVMSITERRREIGIMKSLGADEWAIRLLFLMESAVIGAIGAATGIVCGWMATRIVSVILRAVLEREGMPVFDPFAMPLWLITLAFAFGLVMSLLAGFYPASRAARVDPVEALRNE